MDERTSEAKLVSEAMVAMLPPPESFIEPESIYEDSCKCCNPMGQVHVAGVELIHQEKFPRVINEMLGAGYTQAQTMREANKYAATWPFKFNRSNLSRHKAHLPSREAMARAAYVRGAAKEGIDLEAAETRFLTTIGILEAGISRANDQLASMRWTPRDLLMWMAAMEQVRANLVGKASEHVLKKQFYALLRAVRETTSEPQWRAFIARAQELYMPPTLTGPGAAAEIEDTDAFFDAEARAAVMFQEEGT